MPARRAAGRPRTPQQGLAEGRTARLQALRQRLHHQGAGARPAAGALGERDVDRAGLAAPQVLRCRRRGRRRRRPLHARHPPRRDEDAVGNLARDEGSCRARAQAPSRPARVPGRHDLHFQSRHVRHHVVRRRDQPAACDHPRGRRRAAQTDCRR